MHTTTNILIFILFFTQSIYSYSFSDLFSFDFGSNKRGGRREIDLTNSEYGECEWYDDSSIPLNMNEPHVNGGGIIIKPVAASTRYTRQFNPYGFGETNNQLEFTGAHRSLEMGSYATVMNEDDGRSVVVRITERGPYVAGRIMSLSSAAFHQISDLDKGVIPCLIAAK